jgi:hypothetical protein
MAACTVSGCDKPARSKSAELCPMHYHRQYRHGDVTKVATESGITGSLGRQYRTTQRPDHPLAPPCGRVYVHRIVLYDKLGPGPHPCHWCGTDVDWLDKSNPRALYPDHLNHDGSDNRPENLVAACQPCNTTRGWWSNNDTVAITSGRRPPVTANPGSSSPAP